LPTRFTSRVQGPGPVVAGSLNEIGLPPTESAKVQVRHHLEDHYPQVIDGLVIERMTNEPPPSNGSRVDLRWQHPDGAQRPVNDCAT
jgi:hypothetical protein